MALPVPIAYWPFDEATGATAADASGNGHLATLVTATWDTSALKKFGAAALAHSGAGRGASFTPINLGTVHSIAFWLNGWTTPAVIIGGALDFYGSFLDTVLWYYGVGTGNWLSVSHGGLSGSHHFVITRNGTAVIFYKDGAPSNLVLGSNTPLTVGTLGSYDAGTVPLVGTLDDVRFYDTALSPAQVAELYALTPPPPVTPPPVLAGELDRRTLTTATGTLNATWTGTTSGNWTAGLVALKKT